MGDSQTIAITVNNVNVPPVLTSPGNKTVNENTASLLPFRRRTSMAMRWPIP